MKTHLFFAGVCAAFLLTLSPEAHGRLSQTWISTPQELIPDNNPLGVSDTIVVTTPITSISDVQLTLDILGGYDGDFYAYLRSSSGGFAVLLNRAGSTAANPYGSADSGFEVTFSDAAPDDIHLANAGGGPVVGTWQPDARSVSPLNALDTSARSAFLNSFVGLNPNSTWTLFIADLSPSGVGTLENWSLTVSSNVAPVPDSGDSTISLLVTALAALGVSLRANRRQEPADTQRKQSQRKASKMRLVRQVSKHYLGMITSIRARLATLSMALLLGAALGGCTTENEVTKRLENAAADLDKIQDTMSEWGRASISGFALVPDRATHTNDTAQFYIDYTLPMSSYVENVRNANQGVSTLFTSNFFGLDLEGNGSNLPTAPDTTRAATTSSTNGSGSKSSKRGSSTNSDSSSRTQNGTANAPVAEANNNSTIPPTKEVVASPGTQLPETTILKLAATAKETERILNFMTHPLDVPGNKQVYFAIGQVSVMPGWRTRKDYVCEVDARFTYASTALELAQKAGKLGGNREALLKAVGRTNFTEEGWVQLTNTAGGTNPYSSQTIYGSSFWARRVWGESTIGMVSAFPFTDAQVFDLQNAYSSQVRLLLSLAAAYMAQGYQVDAKVILTFVKEVQKTLATRNAMPTVIPGVDPSTLTYRFDPEAMAMTDPTQSQPKAGRQLLPTSIPIMVLCICDKKDLAHWSKLGIDVETRWIPRAKHTPLKKFADILWTWRRPHDADLSTKEGLLNAQKLGEAYEQVYRLQTNDTISGHSGFAELRRRLAVIETTGLSRTMLLNLPESAPVVTLVDPSTITTGSEVPTFTLLGDYLPPTNEPAPQLQIGGFPLQIVTNDESRIIAKFAVTNRVPLKPGSYTLQVETLRGSFSLTNAVTVTADEPKPTEYRII